MKETNITTLYTNKIGRESIQMNVAIDTDLSDRIDNIQHTIQLCTNSYVSKGVLISDLIRAGLNAQDTIMIDSYIYSYSDFERGYATVRDTIVDILMLKLDNDDKVSSMIAKLNLNTDKLNKESYEKIKTFLLKDELSKVPEFRIINLKYIDDLFPVTDFVNIALALHKNVKILYTNKLDFRRTLDTLMYMRNIESLNDYSKDMNDLLEDEEFKRIYESRCERC